MSRQELKRKGFTIIEVVLVLAIAALIFLMVFIAFPALQRNQRDTARKQELSKVISAVTSYQSAKRGASPVASKASEFAGFLDATVDGSGNIVLTTTTLKYIAKQTSGTGGATPDTIVLAPQTGCNQTGDGFAAPKSSRQMAAMTQMENGDAYVCQAS